MAQYDYVLRNTEDILDKLTALDYLCSQQKVEAELVILGGAGILLLMEQQGKTFRLTRDIDVNLLNTNNQKALVDLFRIVGIDVVGGVMEVPPMADFKKVDLYFN